jgi:SMC interacting uncharacterized protein involved in chromosome segregation
MDVVSISSVASIVGVIGVGFSVLKEKIKHAEEMGQIKQQIRSLEARMTEQAGHVMGIRGVLETSNTDIRNDISQIQQSIVRLEASITQLNNNFSERR